jgi:hypothetical protein
MAKESWHLPSIKKTPLSNCNFMSYNLGVNI